jgi:hypothetical protein
VLDFSAGALGAAGGLATWVACDRPVPTPDEPGDTRLCKRTNEGAALQRTRTEKQRAEREQEATARVCSRRPGALDGGLLLWETDGPLGPHG